MANAFGRNSPQFEDVVQTIERSTRPAQVLNLAGSDDDPFGPFGRRTLCKTTMESGLQGCYVISFHGASETCGIECSLADDASLPATPVSQRAALGITLISALFCAFISLKAPGPYGDLSGIHTDHLRHPYAAWIFLHRGLDLYRLPFGEAANGIEFPHPMRTWEQVPYPYPPGALVLFLPLALIGKWLPMEHETFARICLAFTVALAHWALFLSVRRLGRVSVGTVFVGLLCWLHLVRGGLQGFYDAAWLALGVLGIDALERGKAGAAVSWLSLAAAVHYRAIVLFPVGIAAFVRAVRGRSWRNWPWDALILSGAIVTVGLVTFALMDPGSEGFWERPPLASSKDWGAVIAVVAATASIAALAAWWADPIIAAVVLVTGGLALIDSRYWWHASVLLVAPLAVGALRPARRIDLTRVLLVLWAVLLRKLSWGGLPTALFREIGRTLRFGG